MDETLAAFSRPSRRRLRSRCLIAAQRQADDKADGQRCGGGYANRGPGILVHVLVGRMDHIPGALLDLILQVLVLFPEWFCIFCSSHASILTRSAEITTGSGKDHRRRKGFGK